MSLVPPRARRMLHYVSCPQGFEIIRSSRLLMIKTTVPPPPSRTDADLTGEDAARVTTLLPPQLLQSGEVIVLLLKPSLWFILLESLGTLTLISLILVAGIAMDNADLVDISQRDLVLLAVGVTAVRLFWQFLEWLSRVYVLTDLRVIRVKGVLRVQVFETALKNIQHTTTLFSLRERFFGLGTIAFATAGTGGHEAAWSMVARPLEVNQVVIQTLNRYR